MAEGAADCWFSSSTTIPSTPISSTPTSSSTGPRAATRSATPSTRDSRSSGTPTELFVDKNGQEIDWIVGYGPPADKFLEKVKKALAGVDTYAALNAQYAKDPTNVEVAYKLAEKCSNRYGVAEMEARAKELYQKILTMDLGGRTASYYDEDYKATVPYVEAAEYNLAQTSAYGRKPDPTPLRAFIKNRPASVFVKNAYAALGYYYSQMASKEDATAYFEEYTAKDPDDRSAIGAYVERIIKDKARSTRVSPWPRSSRRSPAIPAMRTTQQHLAHSMRSRTIRPRPKRNTARTSPRATCRTRSSP